MDVSERIDDFTQAFQTAMEGILRGVSKAIPVIAQASDGHTVSAQAVTSVGLKQPDGSIIQTALPPFADAPAHFPGGGGVTHTHPIAKGDEGVMLIVDRNQDSWHQNGGANNAPVDDRAHHLADCRYLPGGRSNPRKLDPPPSSSSSQSRSDNGNHVVDVHPQNGVHSASTVKIAQTSGGSSTVHTPDGIRAVAQVIAHNCGSAGSGF